jgi:GDP-L-fucose synthase
MKKTDRIFIAGHRGLVGSALVRNLESNGYQNLVLRNRQELDLLNQSAVHHFFSREKIDHVFLVAGKVGGIIANRDAQADFLYENLLIAANVMGAAAKHPVSKLLYLGSSCVYPKLATQPITEDSLMTSALEPTNEGYAVAKIAGLKMCEMFRRQYGKNFFAAMPTNLYGPGDNFHPTSSHVIPGMMRRFHEAKIKGAHSVTLWGQGTALREFMHVDDLARACVMLTESSEYDGNLINIGSGMEISINDLAQMMKEVVGFKGEIVKDLSKPDGTPRKLLNTDKLKTLGFKPAIALKEGLTSTYQWALKNLVFETAPAAA